MKQSTLKNVDLDEIKNRLFGRPGSQGSEFSAVELEEACGKIFIGGGATREVGEDEFEDVVDRVFR